MDDDDFNDDICEAFGLVDILDADFDDDGDWFPAAIQKRQAE